MQIRKKLLSIFLALILMVSSLPVQPRVLFAEEEETAENEVIETIAVTEEDSEDGLTEEDPVIAVEEQNEETGLTEASAEIETAEETGVPEETPVRADADPQDDGDAAYVAYIGETGYASLTDALAAAKDGDTVTLAADVDLTKAAYSSNRIPLSKSVTIDGSGKTITVANRGFGVGMNASHKLDVAFRNVTIINVSASGRCIDTRGNIGSLTLTGTTLKTTGGGTTQPLTIGGNQADAAEINITDSTIQTNDEGTAYYAIITFNPVNMTITGSTIKGWACIYAKGKDGSAGSAGSVFTIRDSELVSKNIYNGTSNAFAMFMVEDNDVKIDVTGSKLDVISTGNQKQAIVATVNEGVEVELGEGNDVTLTGDNAVVEFNNGDPTITGGHFNKDVSEYLAKGLVQDESGNVVVGTLEVTLEPQKATYDGTDHKPAVTVALSGKQLSEGYTAVWKDSEGTEVSELTDAGIYTLTVTYGEASATKTFTIAKFNIANEIALMSADDVTYTGSAVRPDKVTYETNDFVNGTFREGTDYTVVANTDNVDAGTASMTISGINNYGGQYTVNYKIVPADLKDVSVTIDPEDYYYGEADVYEPAVSARLGDYVLIEGKDYTVSYSDNTSAGTAKVTLTPAGRNFTGEALEKTFAIKKVVARIGETKYEDLASAFAAAKAGDLLEILEAGTYVLPAKIPNITVQGNVEGVVFAHKSSGNISTVSEGITFKNVTFDLGNVNYHGFQHAGTIEMTDCTINGKLFSYGAMNFTECTFNAPGSAGSGISSKDYSMWAYSGDLNFNGCIFNGAGKFLNVYNESGAARYTINATGCSFNSTLSNKAAFNVKETSGSNVLRYTLNLNSNTINENFPAASDSEVLTVISGLVQVDDRKAGGTLDGGEIIINIGGEEKYATPRIARVAAIGDREFVTLQEAIDAAEPGDTINVYAGVVELPAAAVIPANVTIKGAGPEQTTLMITTSNGDGVKLANQGITISDLKIDGSNITSGGYKSLVNVEADGCVVDNVVFTGGGTSTWNSSILVEKLTAEETFTVRNADISGSFRGILRESCNGNLVIEDSQIDAVYPFNVDGGKGGTVTVTGSKLHGWTSYSGVDKVTFSDCEFSMGNSGYDCVAAYVDTEFNNCTFDSSFEIYAQTSPFTFTLNDCAKDGTALTAENFADSFSDEDVWKKCDTYVDGQLVGAVARIVSGAETKSFKKLQSALDAAHEMAGEVTVELTADISEVAVIHQKAGLDLTVDGADKTLTGQLYVDGDGRYSDADTLTIRNLKFVYDAATYDDAFIDVPNTKTTGKPYTTDKYNYAHNIAIENCEFTGEGTTTVAIRVASGAGANGLTVDGVKVSGGHSFLQLVGVKDLTVTGSEVSGVKNGINISGGDGAGTISGNILSANVTEGYALRLKDACGMTVTLSDNTFSGGEGLINTSTASGKLIITDGRYAGPLPSDAAKLTVEGGLFSVKPAEAVCGEGKYPLDNFEEATKETYPYTVGEAAASITRNGQAFYYPSLAAAVEAAENDDTVVLLKDTKIESVAVTKKITLDLESHEVSSDLAMLFDVKAGGDLTITGNGKISGPANGQAFDGKSLISVDGGKLLVENGTLTATGSGSDGMYGVYVLNGGSAVLGTEDGQGPTIEAHFAALGTNNTTATATIVVNGGIYTANAAPSASDWWSYFCAPVYAAAAGTYTLNGGTFNGCYGLSSRYANVDQDIMIGDVTINAASGIDVFIDKRSGSEGTADRHIQSTDNAWTLPEEYAWAPIEGGLYEVTEQYTVSFDTNGGVPETIETQIVLAGQKAVKPADPTKEGYTFLGWYDGEDAYDFAAPVKADIELTAKWQINEYTVSFDSAGGSEVASQTVKYNETASRPADPVKEGYTFLGWYDGEDAYDFAAPVKADIELTAKWQINDYTITYLTDGNVYQTYNVEYNSITPIPEDPAGPDANHVFKEWTPAVAEKVTGDATYEAVWKGALRHVIYSDGEGNVLAMYDVEYGSFTPEFAPDPLPSKAGYRLDQNDLWTPDVEETVTRNVVYELKWIKGLTVTFDPDNGEEVTIVPVDENTKVQRPEDPELSGHTFIGWYDGNNEFDFDTLIVSDLTLKAKYDVNFYTVTFDSNGGSEVESQTVEYNKTVSKPADPTRELYVFLDWMLDGEAYDFDTPVTSSLTLTAQWAEDKNGDGIPDNENKYTVTFDLNGKEAEAVPDQEVYYGNKVAKPADPKADKNVFMGWYKDAEGKEAWDFENDVVTENVKLFASWKKDLNNNGIPDDEEGFDWGEILPQDIEYLNSKGILTPEKVPEGLWVSELKDLTYDGTRKTQEFRVYYNKKLLKEGTDYAFTFKNNVKAGLALITIKGKGNYTGTLKESFNILPAEVNEDNTTVIYKNVFTLSSKIQKPTFTIKHNGKTLKLKTDYTVAYANSSSKDVGEYGAVITFKGNYTGKLERSYSIIEKKEELKSISTAKVTGVSSYPYSGHEITQNPTVKLGKVTLAQGSDYTVSYRNNVEAGTAYVIIDGIGSYKGQIIKDFKITPLKLTAKNVEVTGLPAALDYTGEALKPELTIRHNAIILEEGRDYALTYAKNVNAGTASITVKGKGNYSGSFKKTFKISKLILKDEMFTLDGEYPYQKGGAVPVPETDLILNKDYTLTYKANKKPGLAAITINGKGNYSGSITRSFTVTAADIGDVKILAQDKAYSAKANAWKSVPVLTDTNGKKLKAGTDYDKNYVYTKDGAAVSGTPSVGDVITVTVKAKGSYTGEISTDYRITKASIAKAKIKVNVQYYDLGEEIEPGYEDIRITLNKDVLKGGEDYEILSYESNTLKGKGSITIRGIGNYGGTRTVKFPIKQRSFGLTIKFNPNGATSGSTKDQMIYKDTKLVKNGYKRTGYTFVGWNTEWDGSGTFYDNKALFSYDREKAGTFVILYAIWKQN